MELWNEKVFSQLATIGFKPRNSFIIYLIVNYLLLFKILFSRIYLHFQFLFKMYHEATLVNLLETVLFHPDVCKSLGDSVVDLVDYIYRKMTDQIRMWVFFNEICSIWFDYKWFLNFIQNQISNKEGARRQGESY